MELSPQPSINDVRGGAMAQLVARLGALDLTPLLVYRLDSVPDSALVALAWQFDMLEPQWQLEAPSGITLRNLLKLAIPMHRTLGTPAAIINALEALGFPNVTIQEGQASWGGNSWPSNEGWAVFRVLIPFGSASAPTGIDDITDVDDLTDIDDIGTPGGGGLTITAALLAQIIAAINFFKPTRSWLDSLWFLISPILDQAPTPTDFIVSIFSQYNTAPTPTDIVSAPAWPLADTKTIAPKYNDHFVHAGITYGANEPAVADDDVTVNGAAISPEE